MGSIDFARQPNRSLHSLCSAHTNSSRRVSSWRPKQKLVTPPGYTRSMSVYRSLGTQQAFGRMNRLSVRERAADNIISRNGPRPLCQSLWGHIIRVSMNRTHQVSQRQPAAYHPSSKSLCRQSIRRTQSRSHRISRWPVRLWWVQQKRACWRGRVKQPSSSHQMHR